MPVTLDKMLARESPKRQKAIKKRAAELIAEEMSLRDLRNARKKTQTRLAKELGIKQENVSRIEKRADLLISTLRRFIGAMGGKLRLVVEFPDRPAIELTGFSEPDNEPPSKQ